MLKDKMFVILVAMVVIGFCLIANALGNIDYMSDLDFRRDIVIGSTMLIAVLLMSNKLDKTEEKEES